MARSYGRGADVTPHAVFEEAVLEHIADPRLDGVSPYRGVGAGDR